MKSRPGALLLLAAVSLLVFAVAACNDDDDEDGDGSTATATAAANEELTLYFNDLAAIQGELSEGTGIIADQSEGALGGDPAQARQTLNALQDAGQAALADLDELEPPSEAADAHAALAAAGEAYLAAIDGLANELQNVQAGAEYDEFLAGTEDPESEYQQAKADLQAACEDMQTVVDDSGVDVALECPV